MISAEGSATLWGWRPTKLLQRNHAPPPAATGAPLPGRVLPLLPPAAAGAPFPEAAGAPLPAAPVAAPLPLAAALSAAADSLRARRRMRRLGLASLAPAKVSSAGSRVSEL